MKTTHLTKVGKFLSSEIDISTSTQTNGPLKLSDFHVTQQILSNDKGRQTKSSNFIVL